MAIAWVNDKLRLGRPVTESGAGTGTSVQWPSRHMLFIQEFVSELHQSISELRHVFIREQTDYMSVYVVCAGNLEEFEDHIYAVEGNLLGRFPGLLVDLHLLEMDRTDIASLAREAREVTSS